MATLYLICEDRSAVERYEIGDRPLVVGRGELADVRIRDEALSRQHFLLLQEDGGYLIEDLNSRNGTWVGGRRVLAAKLRHNDCILAGHTLFRFNERHVTATRFQREAGPHGTVVLPATPEPEYEAQSFA